jgi:hypothetical protein
MNKTNNLLKCVHELQEHIQHLENSMNVCNDSILQISYIVRHIEMNGSITMKSNEVLAGTMRFLRNIRGTYSAYLSEDLDSYIIVRSGVDGMPDYQCPIDNLHKSDLLYG